MCCAWVYCGLVWSVVWVLALVLASGCGDDRSIRPYCGQVVEDSLANEPKTLWVSVVFAWFVFWCGLVLLGLGYALTMFFFAVFFLRLG